MSVNRILKKRRQQSQSQSDGMSGEQQRSDIPQSVPAQPRTTQQQAKYQQQYQKYAQYSQYNPSQYKSSNAYLPYNASLYNRFKLPISIMIPPVWYQMEPAQKSIDKIPRCGSCRAYMNYYNQCKKKSFNCFVCGKQNSLVNDYTFDADNIQLTQPSYHVLGGQNVYSHAPPQNALVFLVDLNNSSFQSKMLYYFVAATKQILSRQQLDETQIYFFTYDDVVHEYDFSGQQVKCTVFDPSIQDTQARKQQSFLINIREKLFILLDTLQQIAQHNKKQGSNFYQAFVYVHQVVKHTGGKIFVFQCNEAISGQSFVNQYIKNADNQVGAKPKSFLQTRNKTLFRTLASNFLDQNISCSFFIFQRSFKNVRVFGDFAKLTNSQILVYRKDTPEDLMKFYHDLYYLLETPYYSNVLIQLILSPGWYFTAVYGNLFRVKQYISFKFCHLQPSKRVCVTVLPKQSSPLPYFSIQIVTNYLYNRQHFVTINTVVLPLTTSLQKLYANQDYLLTAVTLHKTYLSCLRLEQINQLKNKMIKHLGSIWKGANQFYKKKVTLQIDNFILACLGMLKSPHFQLQSVNDSIVLDTIIYQRNFLQSCGANEVQNFFNPYLFNLTAMTGQMCRDEQSFLYPQTCQLRFNSVKEGMFLLDNGLSLYLYIAKLCSPAYLKMLFGKQKLPKNQILSEQLFPTDNLFAQQVANLIRVSRQQKCYGWVPLYVVRCGQGSLHQKLFYMNFYAEKYVQFRGFNMTLVQFTAVLNQQY